jgi:DNA-binding MarR family transcriptional regulator
METQNYEQLKLSNQLCFPLYVCSKEIVRRYKPFLDQVDLTYTQYIVMMAFWEKSEMNVKDLGKKLFLDSGTLTPVLKTLESKGFITRERSKEDERNLIVRITDAGLALREKCASIPSKMGCCIHVEPEEFKALKSILDKFLMNFQEK